MWTKQFWLDTTERALKTFAQALIGVVAVGTPIFHVDWISGLGIAATATVVSVLTSLASGTVGDTTSAAALPNKAPTVQR